MQPYDFGSEKERFTETKVQAFLLQYEKQHFVPEVHEKDWIRYCRIDPFRNVSFLIKKKQKKAPPSLPSCGTRLLFFSFLFRQTYFPSDPSLPPTTRDITCNMNFFEELKTRNNIENITSITLHHQRNRAFDINVHGMNFFPSKLKKLSNLLLEYNPTPDGIQALEKSLRSLPQSLRTLTFSLKETSNLNPGAFGIPVINMQDMFPALASLSFESKPLFSIGKFEIIHFPTSLRELRSHAKLLDPAHLPDGLVCLVLGDTCVTTLHPFPSTLRRMKFESSPWIISKLPDRLECLSILHNTKSMVLPTIVPDPIFSFPHGLRRLKINFGYHRIHAEALMSLRSLRYLSIKLGMSNELPQLPEGLTHLYIVGKKIPPLPNTLRKLRLVLKHSSHVLVVRFPSALESLGIQAKGSTFRLCAPLPLSLKTLKLGHGHYGQIPKLPFGLKKIILSDPTYRIKIPFLPDTVVYAEFWYISNALCNSMSSYERKKVACSLLTNIPPSVISSIYPFDTNDPWVELESSWTSFFMRVYSFLFQWYIELHSVIASNRFCSVCSSFDVTINHTSFYTGTVDDIIVDIVQFAQKKVEDNLQILWNDWMFTVKIILLYTVVFYNTIIESISTLPEVIRENALEFVIKLVIIFVTHFFFCIAPIHNYYPTEILLCITDLSYFITQNVVVVVRDSYTISLLYINALYNRISRRCNKHD